MLFRSDSLSGQTDLFGGADEKAVKSTLQLEHPLNPASTAEQLKWEKELLGVYLSQHPLEAYEVFLSEQSLPISTITTDHHNRKITIGGYITNFREIMTKNGKKMAFVSVADKDNEIEVVLFPETYQKTLGIWDKIGRAHV